MKGVMIRRESMDSSMDILRVRMGVLGVMIVTAERGV
jgi:hypothetical protein